MAVKKAASFCNLDRWTTYGPGSEAGRKGGNAREISGHRAQAGDRWTHVVISRVYIYICMHTTRDARATTAGFGRRSTSTGGPAAGARHVAPPHERVPMRARTGHGRHCQCHYCSNTHGSETETRRPIDDGSGTKGTAWKFGGNR
jgi:hypothetical protein